MRTWSRSQLTRLIAQLGTTPAAQAAYADLLAALPFAWEMGSLALLYTVDIGQVAAALAMAQERAVGAEPARAYVIALQVLCSALGVRL